MTSTEPDSRFAALTGPDGAAIQTLLARAVAEWRGTGAKIAGVLAESHGLPDRTCSAGLLRDVASGTAYPIYLETAPSHTSCHLDAEGVEAACVAILGQIAGSDLVVLSKFGKLEAMGRGLLPAFRAALAAGLPLLTSVSEKHRDAWHGFAPHAAILPADAAALHAWRQPAHGNTRSGVVT